ncbi:hypothetical protein D3C85_1168670 [compost metagenome]
MHGFVQDQLFQQRGGRIPGQWAQFQQAHVKPCRQQAFQFLVQPLDAGHLLAPAQHVGTQVHQEAQAVRQCVEALEQARALAAVGRERGAHLRQRGQHQPAVLAVGRAVLLAPAARQLVGGHVGQARFEQAAHFGFAGQAPAFPKLAQPRHQAGAFGRGRGIDLFGVRFRRASAPRGREIGGYGHGRAPG